MYLILQIDLLAGSFGFVLGREERAALRRVYVGGAVPGVHSLMMLEVIDVLIAAMTVCPR
jgi:hypothetical protein